MTASTGSFEWLAEVAPVRAPAGGTMTMLLDHDVEMVAEARHAVGHWLDQRGCRTCDDAVLVLSELVTNAMVHAGAGCTVGLQHRDDLLRLEVRDPSPREPVLRPVAPAVVGGHGLRVVDALAESWGWERTSDGKRVWAIVPAAVHPHPDGDGGAASRSS